MSLRTVDPLYQGVIGQRVALSFHDRKVINRAYCSGQWCAEGGGRHTHTGGGGWGGGGWEGGGGGAGTVRGRGQMHPGAPNCAGDLRYS